jgi:sulfur-carrier protein
MPRVVFTPHLQRHVDSPPRQAEGRTLREVLENVFAENPKLKGYILDDQQRLRKHVIVFIDNVVVTDRAGLSDAVTPESEIHVMQALSGG